jgi:polynucleotide 5'-kinase involved in rRNA processing
MQGLQGEKEDDAQMFEDEQVTYRVESQEEEDENLDPPFVIAVQGSSESGKTTLIKSLVYHFTK